MKTKNQFNSEKIKSEIFNQLQYESLTLSEMLQVKGGGGDDDPPEGNETQEDGYN